MVKVVSTALFGPEYEKYARYVPAFIRGALHVFPIREDWRTRFCVDSTVAKSETGALIRRYAREGLCESVIIYGTTTATPPLCWAMMQRLGAAFEPGVEYAFSRDLDAPPMPRDRECCEAFVRSKTAVHTIHDNEQHSGVMGGLCGVWAPEFMRQTGFRRLEDLRDWAGGGVDWGRKGADQQALNGLLSSRPQLTLLEHRYGDRQPGSYPCDAWSTRVPDAGALERRGIKWICRAVESQWSTVVCGADRIGPHLGCAGYDHEAAVEFWDKHGDYRIADALHACEAGR